MAGGPRKAVRPVIDCPHGGRHKHGTPVAYTQDGCRCDPCTEAAVGYARRRFKQVAYGRWDNGFTDAAPAMEHALALQGAGLGYRRVAALSGLSQRTVRDLLSGRFDRISKRTSERIMAVSATELAGGAKIDGTGSRRRVEALMVAGWSLARVADRARVDVDTLRDILRGHTTTVATAATVRALYDELWNQKPSPATRFEAGAQTRARNLARRKGFLPALAWDDDTIDDPAAEPYRPDAAAACSPGRKVTREFIEDLEWLRSTGVGPKAAAERLGIRHDSLLVALRRHGETELLAWAAGSERAPRSSNAA